MEEFVTLCLTDLAEGYQCKFGDTDRGYILKCCETALKYFPDYINALLLQAETTMKAYRKQPDKKLTRKQTIIYQSGSHVCTYTSTRIQENAGRNVSRMAVIVAGLK